MDNFPCQMTSKDKYGITMILTIIEIGTTQPWDIYEISQNNPYLSQGSGFQARLSRGRGHGPCLAVQAQAGSRGVKSESRWASNDA